MNADGYILDKDRGEALRRLRAVERLEDPATIRHLERIGVAPGWRCLEAGAGAGSIAGWLARRAGPTGRVVAVDAQTDLLEAARLPGVEIRQGDLAECEIEKGAFDLVHTRNVLVHVPRRESVLGRLAAAVGGGGWILIEEPDLVADGPDPASAGPQRDLYTKVTREIVDFITEQGLDPHFGGRVLGRLRALDFEALGSEGLATTFQGGRKDHASPHGDVFADLAGPIVSRGRIQAEEFDAFLALYRDPGFFWRDGLRVATWGRRP